MIGAYFTADVDNLDPQFIDDLLVRIVKQITDKFVVGLHPIEKITGLKNGVVKLPTDFGFH